VALGVLAIVIWVIGCGGGADYSSPRATFNTMWEAAKAGNKDAMMACYSDETRKELEEFEEQAKKSGAKQKKSPTEGMIAKAKRAEPQFGKQKINGDKATLEVTVEGKTNPFRFVRERGAWKIDMMAELRMMKGLIKGMGEGMGEMMKGMTEGLKKAMEEGMKKAFEGLKKKKQ